MLIAYGYGLDPRWYSIRYLLEEKEAGCMEVHQK